MSLEQAIKHKKEKRKPYYGSKAFDPSCRNNTCPECLSNKLYKNIKREMKAKEEENGMD